jgi:hypothetical protein
LSDTGPEPAHVLGALTPASDGHWRAWPASSEDIHQSTKGFTIEGVKVIPDRRRIQDALFHTRNKNGGAIQFPLHVTDGSITVSEHKVEGKVVAGDPRTEG